MTSNLALCHVNAQSLNAHFHEFLHYFSRNFYHIIAVSETWLNSSIPSSSVSLPHHTLLRHDRTDRPGGGVALFIHVSLKSRVLEFSPPSETPEFLFAEISFLSNSLLCGVAYRPPQTPFSVSFETALFNLSPLYSHVILSGDLNSNLLAPSSATSYLTDLVYSLNLYLVPFSATHHTSSTDTWLDVFIIDSPSSLISSAQIPVPFLSLHDLIQISYHLDVPTPRPRSISYRNLDSLSTDLILPDLESIAWDSIYLSDSVDSMVQTLTSHLLSILDKHAPLKTRTVRHAPAPWITTEIRDLMRRRDAARRRHRRTRHPEDWDNFKRLRNLTQSRLRKAYVGYFLQAFSSAPDSKSKWSLLRRLNLCSSSAPPSSYPVTPDQLNSHFTSLSTSSSPIRAPNPLPFNPDNFFFSYITPSDLLTSISKSRTNAVGPDGIPVKLLKLSLPVIFPVLLHIYNFSLQNSVFPQAWKQALVHPLNKVPNPSSPTDFRPISILSNLSKPLERLVQAQLASFLESSNLLDPLQSGFRSGFSTQSAITKISQDLHSAIDRQLITILVLLDFSKAFDTIDHSLLLSKLQSLSFSHSSISWFLSFLSNRSQSVTIPNRPRSSPLPLTSGVAQGSSISPTLFSIYINDLPRSISHCSYHIYADDLQIYLSFPPSQLLSSISLIQADLDSISAWAEINKLILNATKTKAITIGSIPLLNSLPPVPPLLIDNQPIQFCRSIKNLGVVIDENLSWKSHVSQLSRRSFSILRLFRRSRHALPPNIRKLLVSSLVLPHFDYGCVAYGGLSGDLEDRLKRLMNCFIRFIFGAPRYSHVSAYYTELNWLYPSFRRLYFLGSFLYQTIHSQSPAYIFQSLTFVSSVRTRSTRSRLSDLYVPTHRSASFDHSFLSRAASLWNSLPPNIRHASSLPTFKSRLFQHLLSLQAQQSR